MVIVEALKNIGGISYFSDYTNYAELNLRKHQAAVCPQAVSSHILAAATEDDNGGAKDVEVAGEGTSGDANVAEVVQNVEPQFDA